MKKTYEHADFKTGDVKHTKASSSQIALMFIKYIIWFECSNNDKQINSISQSL